MLCFLSNGVYGSDNKKYTVGSTNNEIDAMTKEFAQCLYLLASSVAFTQLFLLMRASLHIYTNINSHVHKQVNVSTRLMKYIKTQHNTLIMQHPYHFTRHLLCDCHRTLNNKYTISFVLTLHLLTLRLLFNGLLMILSHGKYFKAYKTNKDKNIFDLGATVQNHKAGIIDQLKLMFSLCVLVT